MTRDSIKSKAVYYIFALVIIFILLFTPLFAIVGAVTKPFEMVKDMIANIGNFFVSDDTYTNDVFIVIEQYFKYGDGYKLLASDYKPIIIEYEEDIYVPDNYLLIPNILVGNEHPGSDLIEQMHRQAYDIHIETEIEYLYDEDGNPIIDEETGKQKYEIVEIEVYELVDEDEYARRIKSMAAFSDGLSDITSTTLANYIRHFNYIAGEAGLDEEYLALYAKDGWIYPFTSYHPITAGLGNYSPFGKVEKHNGVDFGAGCGTAFYSVTSGIVYLTGTNSLRGNFVDILSDDGLIIHYYHMANPYVGNIGDKVSIGDYLGPVGSTGKSSGCHLHLGVESNGSYLDYCKIVDCDNPPIP